MKDKSTQGQTICHTGQFNMTLKLLEDIYKRVTNLLGSNPLRMTDLGKILSLPSGYIFNNEIVVQELVENLYSVKV